MDANDRLKIEDLQKVKNELWDARTKWKDFGEELAVDQGTLDSIAIIERDNPGNCLREMLANWLRGAPSAEGPSSKPRTWLTIVDALRAKAVGCGAVADEIEKKYNVRGSGRDTTVTAGGVPSQAAAAQAAPLNMKYLTKWNIIPTVAAKWRELSDLLEIDPSITANIEEKTRGAPETACREVFTRWLKGEGSKPSWEELLDALDSLKFTIFVAELKAKLN